MIDNSEVELNGEDGMLYDSAARDEEIAYDDIKRKSNNVACSMVSQARCLHAN